MRILHLVEDTLFAKSVVTAFSQLSVESEFVHLIQTSEGETKWIDGSLGIRKVVMGSQDYRELARAKYDFIWIHALSGNDIAFINCIGGAAKIIWSSFGYDYVRYLGDNIYAPMTRKMVRKNVGSIDLFKGVVLNFAYKIGFYWIVSQKLSRAFRRIDYYSTVVPTEHVLMERIIGRRAKAIRFNYMTGRSMDRDLLMVDLTLNINRILVGNSASMTNNHADVYELLRKQPDAEVYSPLSYGTFAERISEVGAEILGTRFHPVFDFMTLDKYCEFLSTFACAAFGMYRQQALGNIIHCLMLGICIFLSTRNPIYQYLIENGIVVYPIERLREYKIVVNEYEALQEENVRRVRKLFDSQKLSSEISQTIEILRCHSGIISPDKRVSA